MNQSVLVNDNHDINNVGLPHTFPPGKLLKLRKLAKTIGKISRKGKY